MAARSVLVVLVVIATAGLVVGTAIERNSRESHPTQRAGAPSGSEAAEGHEESGSEAGGEVREPTRDAELKPLGVDVEAAPFVALAALASVAMASAVWLRPATLPLLLLVAVAMLAFAGLDVREVAHQLDESRAGLAVLAGVVAVTHAAAGTVAGLMTH